MESLILNSQSLGKFSEKELEVLFPHGLVGGYMQAKPMLLFKNEFESIVIPVWLNAIEAQSLAAYLQNQIEELPGHHFSLSLFEEIGLEFLRFVFVDVDKNHQWLEVHYSYQAKEYKKKLIAESILGFAFTTEAPFYATSEFVRANRHFNVLPDLNSFEDLQLNDKSQQKYLM